MTFEDIYFDPNYGELCELTEEGVAETYFFECPQGAVRNMFIKRTLPVSIDPEQKYFDIVSPYGYGGPLIVDSQGDKNGLVRSYNAAFMEYCNANNIISEFVRFHPILKNHIDFKDVYRTIHMRKTVVTYLDPEDDILLDHFSKSARKNINRAIREGVKVEVIEEPEDLSSFTEIYYDTMERNDADDYYYFPKEYFEGICRLLRDYTINVNIYVDNTRIASGVYFIYGKIMQIHLSGTKREYLHLSPAYLLRYAAMNWAKDHGVEIVHHGGGTTNDPDDTLLRFKQRFSKDENIDYYVGQKIHNEEVYNKLVHRACVKDKGYFPVYRGVKE